MANSLSLSPKQIQPGTNTRTDTQLVQHNYIVTGNTSIREQYKINILSNLV